MNTMYRKSQTKKTVINRNETYEGERIEEKIFRITNNKEPIKDGAPLIYTDRKDGVQAQFDIRTDRFEIAVEAMDKVTKSVRAKRESKPDLGKEAKENMAKEAKTETKSKDGGAESVQTT